MAGTRLLAGPVAVATAGLLAAAALSAPGDPKFAPRRADQAYARTILLRASEVPGTGWTSKLRDFSGANPACFVKHFSLSATTEHGRVRRSYLRTPRPQRGAFFVEADALVFATPAQASTAFRIFTSLGFARCLASAIAAAVPAGQRVTFEVRERTLPGVSVATAGFEITLHVTAGIQHMNVTLFAAALRRGAAVGNLLVYTNGPSLPQADLRRLAGKMAARMTRP